MRRITRDPLAPQTSVAGVFGRVFGYELATAVLTGLVSGTVGIPILAALSTTEADAGDAAGLDPIGPVLQQPGEAVFVENGDAEFDGLVEFRAG